MRGIARALAALLLALLLQPLAGCGGGDADDDERAGYPPVNCNVTPELCK